MPGGDLSKKIKLCAGLSKHPVKVLRSSYGILFAVAPSEALSDTLHLVHQSNGSNILQMKEEFTDRCPLCMKTTSGKVGHHNSNES